MWSQESPIALPICPKCRQAMNWHSSQETNYGTTGATVFHCSRCERYVARSNSLVRNAGDEPREILPSCSASRRRTTSALASG
jgi:hypothetical protein